MSRYIDANAFKKYLKEKFKDVKDLFQTEKMRSLSQTITNDFCRDIDEQPTVDAVPVVRCRECYYKEEKRIMDEDKLWCRKHHMYVTADWFCADGERRTDD